MNPKKANSGVHCRVTSCAYHCDDRDCCSLQSVDIEPCPGCGSGKAVDESMCGSYCKK